MQDLGWLTGSGVHELSRVWLVCSMWDLSSLTRVWTHIPCIGRQILMHWTTRNVPVLDILNKKSKLKCKWYDVCVYLFISAYKIHGRFYFFKVSVIIFGRWDWEGVQYLFFTSTHTICLQMEPEKLVQKYSGYSDNLLSDRSKYSNTEDISAWFLPSGIRSKRSIIQVFSSAKKAHWQKEAYTHPRFCSQTEVYPKALEGNFSSSPCYFLI